MLEIINQYAPVKKHLATVETPYEALSYIVDLSANTMDVDTIIDDPECGLIEDMPELIEQVKNGLEVLMNADGEYAVFNPKELTVDTVNTLLYDVRMSDYKVIEVE
jgi:hypothetical protein